MQASCPIDHKAGPPFVREPAFFSYYLDQSSGRISKSLILSKLYEMLGLVVSFQVVETILVAEDADTGIV